MIVDGGDPVLAFDVDEEDSSWPVLEALFHRWNASDVLTTQFSEEEVCAAAWLELIGSWHHGYPQPQDDSFGYREATYDLTDWCKQCGIGAKQRAPFRMKAEPTWGNKAVLQLNWVFDEFFVTPEVWSDVFRPRGVGSRPVVDTSSRELKRVVQLVVDDLATAVPSGLVKEACTSCGRVKYLPVTRGAFPALVSTPSASMAKTREYFGSGGRASRAVLVSQDVARALVAMKIRGAMFRPVTDGGKDLPP